LTLLRKKPDLMVAATSVLRCCCCCFWRCYSGMGKQIRVMLYLWTEKVFAPFSMFCPLRWHAILEQNW
jgi:hypothetical protein